MFRPGSAQKRARASKRSLEEAARDLRHSLLRDAAREGGAALIAMGHTQDDVVETLLMRAIQGSDVHGLRGIPARRGPFLRPLLACSRAQVLAYLDSLGQPWSEDLSNHDTRFLRNRVRHRLLPILDAEFPGFRTGLLALSRKLSLVSDLVRAQGAGLHWTESGGGYTIDASEFAAALPAVRAWSLLKLYDRILPEGRLAQAPVAIPFSRHPRRDPSRGGHDPQGTRRAALPPGPEGLPGALFLPPDTKRDTL